jgi:hypothetical protein
MAICSKKQSLSSSSWKHNRQRQPAKESTRVEKKKTLTRCSNLEIAEGEDVEVDEDVDE